MSTVPAPPPPPPPPVPSGNKILLLDGQTETKNITEEEFFKEIKESLTGSAAGRLKSDNAGNEVVLVVTMPLQTVILQNGPMCGIVALAEAMEILDNGKMSGNSKIASICSKTLLDSAVQKGYTKQGEMFSVRAMLSLAEQFGASQDHSRIVTLPKNLAESETFSKLFENMVTHLITGYPVLVPILICIVFTLYKEFASLVICRYDADHNHTPSLRKGHAAHWAVVHGLACPLPYHRLSSVMDLTNPTGASISSTFKVIHTSPELVILKPTFNTANNNGACPNESAKFIAGLFTYENTIAISHQGKSLRTALWKCMDLLESNQNLKEVAPKIIAQKQDFVLNESIEEGLCSQILLLK